MTSRGRLAALLVVVGLVAAGCGSSTTTKTTAQRAQPLNSAASKACSAVNDDMATLQTATDTFLGDSTSREALNALDGQLTALGTSLGQLRQSVTGDERAEVEMAITALQSEQSGVSSLLSEGLSSAAARTYPEQLVSPQQLSEQLAGVDTVCSG